MPKSTVTPVAVSRVSLARAQRMIEWALKANTPIHFLGSPGIGKSAVVRQAGKRLGMRVVTLILSQCAPEDVGGIPVPGDGQVARLPIGPIRIASQEPVILFIDEVSTSPLHLQAAALTLVNERFAGDVALHPDTRIVLASNPPESSTGGGDLSPAFSNRITHVHVEPALAEVQAYLNTLGDDGSTLRGLALDYSATLDHAPELVQFDPPPGALSGGAPWASPRAIERGLRLWAAAVDMGESATDVEVARDCLAGAIGESAARALLAILRVRGKLPSIAEVLASPDKAKLPTDTDTSVAALGVVAQVATQDVWAAWIYCERLAPEYRVALLARLAACAPPKSSPHANAGRMAMVRLSAKQAVAMSRSASRVA